MHYIVDVNSSYEKLGCCLQYQQSDVKRHPIGFYSRAFPPAGKKFFVAEIKAVGVVWAVAYSRS